MLCDGDIENKPAWIDPVHGLIKIVDLSTITTGEALDDNTVVEVKHEPVPPGEHVCRHCSATFESLPALSVQSGARPFTNPTDAHKQTQSGSAGKSIPDLHHPP